MKANTAAACSAIIKGIPTINFACFVLCRIISIVSSIATEPPSAAIISNVLSLVRHLCFFAAPLSRIVRAIAKKLITARYVHVYFNIYCNNHPSIPAGEFLSFPSQLSCVCSPAQASPKYKSHTTPNLSAIETSNTP